MFLSGWKVVVRKKDGPLPSHTALLLPINSSLIKAPCISYKFFGYQLVLLNSSLNSYLNTSVKYRKNLEVKEAQTFQKSGFFFKTFSH